MQNDGCAVQEPLATTHHSDDTEAARQVMVSVPERSRLRNDSERACLQKHEDERHWGVISWYPKREQGDCP